MSKLVLVAVLIFIAGCQAQAQTAGRKLTDLSWLSGCWASADSKKPVQLSEQWMLPEGGMMLGMGRTVKMGKAVDFEFMRIEQKGDDIFFIARPKANAEETAFKLISSGPAQVSFENPDHDFPQRVIYKLTGNVLTGRVEGNQNGKFKGIDFPMNRAKCGA